MVGVTLCESWIIMRSCLNAHPNHLKRWIRSDSHQMRIKSMRIHVNATDPDQMRIQCASRCPCESALTCSHCSKFSITPMLIWKQQYSQPIGHFTFHIGAVAICGLLQLHRFCRLRIYLPCLCHHNRQWVTPVLVVDNITHEQHQFAGVHEAF